MNNNYYFLINSLEGGGAERVTINFTNEKIKEWKKVYIVTLKKTNFYQPPQWVIYLPLSNIKNNFLMFLLIPWYVIKFKRILKQYDLTNGMSLLEISNFIHILSKKDAIISFRTHINFFTWMSWYLQKCLIRYLYPKAKKIIVNSEENKHDVAEYLHIPLKNIEVVYNPIDKDAIALLKKEKIDTLLLEKIRWKKVFITTGRLIWQKHHEKILRALKNIDHKKRIYLIVWDGHERKKLEKIARFLWLQDTVIFLGQQKNVFKYLHMADLFLYASEVEGFPNVLIEAREMWVPIITSDFKSGAREVILWKYVKDAWKGIRYPYQGKYWILLDLNKYEEQFFDVYNCVLSSISK